MEDGSSDDEGLADAWAGDTAAQRNRTKELKGAAVPVFDYLGGKEGEEKGKRLECSWQLEVPGPDAIQYAASKKRPANPDDFLMEICSFCSLDLLKMYGPVLLLAEQAEAEAAGLAAAGRGRGSGTAHLPCLKCGK